MGFSIFLLFFSLSNFLPSGGDFNKYYSHSASSPSVHSKSSLYGTDVNLVANNNPNYLNPTYNSKINFIINDEFLSINDAIKKSSPGLSPKQARQKRESSFFDENMNFATPLINNAQNCRKKLNNGSTGKFQISRWVFSISCRSMNLFFIFFFLLIQKCISWAWEFSFVCESRTRPEKT